MPMSQPQSTENELEEQTDGALRTARRQYLQAAVIAQKAHDRLDLEEVGDRTRDGVWNKSRGMAAQAHQTAKQIKRELDRRDAEYKSRREVKEAATNRF